MARAKIILPAWLQSMKNDALLETTTLAEIISLEECRLKQKTIGHITKDQEYGLHFENNILHYIHALEEIKTDVQPHIQEAARHITGFLQTVYKEGSIHPAQMPQLRGPLWVALASAIEPLGGRPRKKVGSLLTDTDDNLVCWDVTRVCPGIEPSARLYVKSEGSHRGHHLFCAERNVIAQFLGVSATMPATGDMAAIHAATNHFEEQLIASASASADVRQHNLTASHCLCSACKRVVAPERADGSVGRNIKSIYTQWNHGLEAALTKPDRNTADSLAHLRRAGIHVSLHRPVQLMTAVAA